MPPILRSSALARARRFHADRRAGPATEFALVGLWVIGLMFVILNLGLLGFSLSALAHGVQAAARAAVVDTSNNAMACSAPARIAGFFNKYAQPPLPAATAGTGSTPTGNPYLAVTWANSGASTPETLSLVGTYKWTPLGFAKLGAIKLRIATVASVPGSAQSTMGAGC